ncbi:uncharacterized protein LOC126702460 [Quercus robur]|uniref:uncharacterized protein LOC126702460 n=1 Tax=Quercus robur TaxID=38942 RepID=UPI002163FF61|nr:uncharacterized protein LOC126702460 [Quercus robur]
MTAALNRFISRSAERCRPFFRLLHKWQGFEWTAECAEAFQQLKEYLSKPPIMSSPEEDEVLFAYLVIAPHAVSFVLMREENGVQKPVYYVSKSLHEAEVRYLSLEKAILAVVYATRKLPHYFQAHTVVILTQLPLKSILRSANYTGRIAKWGTILSAFDIKYMPRTSVKGQVLADLVAEFAECPEEVDMNQGHMDEKLVGLISAQGESFWRVYVDGAANQRGAGLGLVLISPEEVIIKKSLRLGFSATNNESEYETLIMGMSMVHKMGGKAVKLFSDSRLVVDQVRGELEARDPRMQGYLDRVRRMQTKFESFDLLHIPRGENTHADSLATLATSSVRNLPRVIIVEDLCTPTSLEKEVCQINQTSLSPSWMDPILKFLESDILPEDKVEAQKIRRRAPRYWLSEDKKLYKRSFSGPSLLYVPPETAESILEELHEGICGSHTGGRYSTPAYPQGNGQAEAVNKVIVNGLKKRLDDAKGKWVEELPHVLWTYRTTPRRSTGETPFSMTYGAKAVIPLETGFPTLRTSTFSSGSNDAMLEKSLDLIEERRESAMVQLADYQHKLKQGYDSNVRMRPLVIGDLVLRKVLGATKNPNWGKLGPNWEGPYRITSVAGIGAYYLEDLDEKTLSIDDMYE